MRMTWSDISQPVTANDPERTFNLCVDGRGEYMWISGARGEWHVWPDGCGAEEGSTHRSLRAAKASARTQLERWIWINDEERC